MYSQFISTRSLFIASFVTYLLMSFYFLIRWLIFVKTKKITNSIEEQFLAFVIAIITAIFWPIPIIASCWEFINQQKLEFENVIALLFAVVVFSISLFYFS